MKYQHRVMGLLSLLLVITYLDRVCISVAGPRMQDQLGIGPAAWGWVTSVFFLSYGAFEIPSGALGDRIGPRKVLTRIVLWWSAFTTLTGAVSNFYILLMTRFCFGAGEAGAFPNASTVIARWIPAVKRGRACGVFNLSSQFGGAIAPLLVVPIQARYGWRASFFCFGFLGLIWAAVWYAWFRDFPAEKSGLTQVERDEIGPAVPRADHPVAWSVPIKSKNLWILMALTACYACPYFFFQSWFPTYLVKGRGYQESDLWLSALPFVVGACGNWLGGVASDSLVRRFGLDAGRRIAGATGLGSAALFMSAAILANGRRTAVVFLCLVYGAITFQQSSVFAVCLDIGGRRAGTVTGFMNTAAQVGGWISTISYGYLVERLGSYNLPLIPMAALLATGALLWLRFHPTRKLFVEERDGPGIPIAGAVKPAPAGSK
jgi:ACS family glucarate transporter-like MFS transporter